MSDLSVSIVIPAFNEERRLEASLEAVTGFLQTQPWDWEVRVVDDGSSDGTASLVETFRARDARVIVQREPHRLDPRAGGGERAGGHPHVRRRARP